MENESKCFWISPFPLQRFVESPGARRANYSSRSSVLQNGVEQQFIGKKEVVWVLQALRENAPERASHGHDQRWVRETMWQTVLALRKRNQRPNRQRVSRPARCREGMKLRGSRWCVGPG
jgi:hypothetical protein